MYFHIIRTFLITSNIFLTFDVQTTSKHFLNVTFLDTFCICLKKMAGTGVSALIHSILHTFDIAYIEKLTL